MQLSTTKRHIQRCFSLAASSYDKVASLQQQVGEALLDWCHVQPDWQRVVDLGCGTGFTTHQLKARLGMSFLIGLDLSEAMLQQAKTTLHNVDCSLIQADFENIPLHSASVDLLFSNMALQWCQHIASMFAEFKRVLRPNGSMVVSFCCAIALPEQHREFEESLNHFLPPAVILSQVKQAGLAVIQDKLQQFDLHFNDRLALMQFFKKTGANHNLQRRPLRLSKRPLSWHEPLGNVTFTILYLQLTSGSFR